MCTTCRELELSQLRERRQKRILAGICSVARCGKKIVCASLCDTHYKYQQAAVLKYRSKNTR